MESLSEILKRASDLQEKMAEMQGELNRQIVKGVSGGGLVQVEMNGHHDVIRVLIDDCVMDDREVLEDLIAGAVNDAVRRVDNLNQEKMSSLTQGLNVPFLKNMR